MDNKIYFVIKRCEMPNRACGLYDEDRSYDPDCGRPWIKLGTYPSPRWAVKPLRCRCAISTRIPGEDQDRLQTNHQNPLRGSYQIGSLSSFDLSTPRDIITLWIKRSIANGIKSFWLRLPV